MAALIRPLAPRRTKRVNETPSSTIGLHFHRVLGDALWDER